VKAIRSYEAKGVDGAEGLVYEEAPDAVPMIGDVLVEVKAAGITPTELLWPIRTCRAGHPRNPIIPSQEFSGVVRALGWGTAGFEVGDEVYGLIDGYRDGAAAELIAAEARDVALKPASLDFVESAAIPQAALTSWQAMYEHGKLERGQRVAIIGAGGGVGSMAVQLAHMTDAHVIGVGRGNVRDFVMQLGADEFLDTETDRLEQLDPVDLAYATIDGGFTAAAMAIVKPGGTFVSIIDAPADPRPDIRCLSFVRSPSRAQLDATARMIHEGKLKPQVGAVYPLAEARQAFLDKANNSMPGKVILRP
jgi:NADPH:quinone reductase-like Zn-dependent oxidoreductase